MIAILARLVAFQAEPPRETQALGWRLIPDAKSPPAKLPTPPAGKKWEMLKGYEPKIGDVLVVNDETDLAMAGVDSSTFTDAIRATAKEDSAKNKALLAGKRLATIPNQTSIRVRRKQDFKIDDSPVASVYEVDILDGPDAKQSAWILRKSIAKFLLVNANSPPPKRQRDD